MGIGIVVADAAQGFGVELGWVKTFQTNSLIATQPRVLVHRMGANTLEVEVFAGANDEESQSLFESVKSVEVQVGSIHQIDGTGFHHQLVENVNLVAFRGYNAAEGRDVAMQIEQSVHFYRGVFGTVTSPGKQRKTKIDGGAIQSVDRLFQFHSEAFLGIQRAGDANQDLGQVGVDAPVP